MKKSYENNKSEMSAPTWNDKFELPDGSYSVTDIRDYFEYIIKNEIVTHNPPIRIYANKIENNVTFRIKTGYYLNLLRLETMKLLVRTKIKITKDEKGENISRLKITKVVLVHCNIVNNNYQQGSRLLYIYICSE